MDAIYPQRQRTPFSEALTLSFQFTALVCAVKLVEWFFRIDLSGFGIAPRTIAGLIGVVFSPFLHGDFNHLFANVVPLFVLLVFLFWNPSYRPAESFVAIWAVSGLGTWLIGRGGAVHLGASGLIYGLVAYLIAAGFLMKNWRSVVIAVVVFLVYGGIFWGVLPAQEAVSWEGHLCGATAGVCAARRAHR